MRTWLITGGAGFIGSNLILAMRKRGEFRVVNLDRLTYASNPLNLEALGNDPHYRFVHGDIGDSTRVRHRLDDCRPSAVLNFAAESHVDQSIAAPGDFIQTDVIGTFRLLEEIRRYWERLSMGEKGCFRSMSLPKGSCRSRSPLCHRLKGLHYQLAVPRGNWSS
jgi:dTDP-glucose 4,6-dehydratase